MDYKLSGNPKEVEKVIRENRIRIQRGVISFTPLDCEVHTDNSDVIATLQERNAELNEMFANECKEHSAACDRANELQIKLTRLREAGVDIDLILDTPADAADVKTEPDTKPDPKADVKSEPEADSKELTTSDSKELAASYDKIVQPEAEADTKTAKPKRTKKTE